MLQQTTASAAAVEIVETVVLDAEKSRARCDRRSLLGCLQSRLLHPLQRLTLVTEM